MNYKLILIFIVSVLFLYNEKEKFMLFLKKKLNSNIIYDNNLNFLDTKKTIIIVGKGPNLDKFIDNYDKFKRFDKLGLNNSILIKDIKFKYYMRQDFTGDKKQQDKLKQNGYYSKHVVTLNFKKEFNYAVNNNIQIIIPVVSDSNSKRRFWNEIPIFIENSKKTNLINVIFHDNKIFKIEKQKGKIKLLTMPKYPYHPPSVSTTAMLYCISQGYKNILFAGVTNMNGNSINQQYIDYFQLLKKFYPAINFYGIYPTSDNLFEFNITTKI